MGRARLLMTLAGGLHNGFDKSTVAPADEFRHDDQVAVVGVQAHVDLAQRLAAFLHRHRHVDGAARGVQLRRDRLVILGRSGGAGEIRWTAQDRRDDAGRKICGGMQRLARS